MKSNDGGLKLVVTVLLVLGLRVTDYVGFCRQDDIIDFIERAF